MRRTLCCLMTVALVACLSSVAMAEDKCAGAVKLFDGKSLDGWKCFTIDPQVKIDDVWSVKDGLLTTTGEPLGYLHTTKEFKNFKLIVEWRWAPGTKPGNSGVLMRIASKPITFLPKCIEAQLQHGSAGDIWGFYGFPLKGPEDRFRVKKDHPKLGNFVGVGHIKNTENEAGQWNKYEITLNGGNLSIDINGQHVNDATDCEVLSGPIGVQSEGGQVQFRTIKLIPLDD